MLLAILYMRAFYESLLRRVRAFSVYPALPGRPLPLHCPLPASTRFAAPVLFRPSPPQPYASLRRVNRAWFKNKIPYPPDLYFRFVLPKPQGAYRSEHKRGCGSVFLIFSERTRQRTEISPRGARQRAKGLLHKKSDSPRSQRPSARLP